MDIIATIWKDPYHRDRNQRMIDEGVNAFRIKCSHLPPEELAAALLAARTHLNEQTGVRLLADLPEAKLRIGSFPEKRHNIAKDEVRQFVFANTAPADATEIPFDADPTLVHLEVGTSFYSGDGQIRWRVTEVHDQHFQAQALNAGSLKMGQALTIPGVTDTLNHITPAIDAILPGVAAAKADMIAFSFVQDKVMAQTLKAKLEPFLSDDWQPQVIAKIETQSGIDHVDEILEEVDGIMVARGDLALNVPFQKLGLIQKELVRKAREQDKYVIVATGCLTSMLNNNMPNRSDILDVTNAALDGASAIMLCPETAHNEHPEEPVRVARAIINEVKTAQ